MPSGGAIPSSTEISGSGLVISVGDVGVKDSSDVRIDPAEEHVLANSPHSTRLSDGASFYKATTPADTQPVSATSLPLPTGASTENTLLSILGRIPPSGQTTGQQSIPVVIASDQIVNTTTASLQTQIAYTAGGDMEYVGLAGAGQSTATNVWKISKFVYASGNLVSITWADGNTNFDNIWENRGIYQYS